MEPRGKFPFQNVIAIIPARYASTRLPEKLLLPIDGKPLITHTIDQAKKARTVSRVIVATDDDRIRETAEMHGCEVMLTSAEHASGSDRIAEAAGSLPEGSIIVNVQGDEPMISPEAIDSAVESMIEDASADIVTTCQPITSLNELLNGSVVKVVIGENGYALYFSRSPMPFPREAALRHDGDPGRAIREEPELFTIFRKHTGLYVYRREYLLKFTSLPQSRLEKIEMLEQLRALENGGRIKVVEAPGISVGVDTEKDYRRVRHLLEAYRITIRIAEKADLGQIADVHVNAWRGSFSEIVSDDYLESLAVKEREHVLAERMRDTDYRIIVAEDPEHGIVGFIDYGKLDTDNFGLGARIFSFYVLPEFQRCGIGARLWTECFSRLTAAGYRDVSVETLADSPFRRFYETRGGTVAARNVQRLGSGEYSTVIYGWDDLEMK